MASADDDETRCSDVSERDLYAILCVHKQADDETIQRAFRRLTLLYHPDKYVDERIKQLAMELFIQVKRAYDILSDPDKRAIYDALGMKGLQKDDWQIVTRARTTRELVDEFERLNREREERSFYQQNSVNGSIQITSNLMNATQKIDSLDEIQPFFRDLQMTNMSVEQNFTISIRPEDTITIDAVVESDRGRGSGSLSTSIRHILADRSWFRIDMTLAKQKQVGVRYVRNLTQKLQGSISSSFVLLTNQNALGTSGIVLAVSYQLSSRMIASLQWKPAAGSMMKGTLNYDNQKWALSTAVQLSLKNSFGAIEGVYRFPNIFHVRFSAKLFIFGPWIEYGIDRQLTKYLHGSATVVISSRFGVLLRLRFVRGNQTFTFPLPFTRDIFPSSIFYASVLPPIVYLLVNHFILKPYEKSQQDRVEKLRDEEFQERRKEAFKAQEFLRSIAEQVKEREGTDGLIILEGIYGDSSSSVDVTVPLQSSVKDSSLRIDSQSSKSNLTGFYDPCFGREKTLRIRYVFRSRVHSVLYNDNDAILLPNADHLIP